MRWARVVSCGLFTALAACSARQMAAPTGAAPARDLYVWAGDKDGKESDFLAVVDVRPASRTYGQAVATEPVGVGGTMPHQTEYELPGPGRLRFANGHHREVARETCTREARITPPGAPLKQGRDVIAQF